MEIAPEQKLGVIVLTNANDGAGLRYVDRAFELLGPAIARVTASPATPQAVPPAWPGYVGRYAAPACATCAYKFHEIQIQILNGELTMIVPDAENPWTSRVVLAPISPNTFTITSPGFSYDEVGEVLTFDVDGAGNVTRVRTPYKTFAAQTMKSSLGAPGSSVHSTALRAATAAGRSAAFKMRDTEDKCTNAVAQR